MTIRIHSPAPSYHELRGGGEAISQARKATLGLMAMAGILLLPFLLMTLVMSHTATLKRVGAVGQAWSSVDAQVGEMLSGCLVTKGKGQSKMEAGFMLKGSIEHCESNLRGMSYAASQGLGSGAPDMPPVEVVDAAVAQRQAVFHTTFWFNPADL